MCCGDHGISLSWGLESTSMGSTQAAKTSNSSCWYTRGPQVSLSLNGCLKNNSWGGCWYLVERFSELESFLGMFRPVSLVLRFHSHGEKEQLVQGLELRALWVPSMCSNPLGCLSGLLWKISSIHKVLKSQHTCNRTASHMASLETGNQIVSNSMVHL